MNFDAGAAYHMRFSKRLRLEIGAGLGFSLIKISFPETSLIAEASEGLATTTPYVALNYLLSRKHALAFELHNPIYFSGEYSSNVSGLFLLGSYRYMF